MFKFAKYFFIVFLLTTIFPLIVMFAYNSSQIDKLHSKMAKNIIFEGKSKLEYLLMNNSKVQEGDILKRLYLMRDRIHDIKSLKEALGGYEVEIIPNYKGGLNSFYENRNSILYLSTILPYKDSSEGLKIVQKVNLDLLKPSGPYDLELSNEKAPNKVLIASHTKEAIKADNSNKSYFYNFLYNFLNKNRNILYDTVVIKNSKSQIVGYLHVYLNIPPFSGRFDNLLTGLIILFVGIISSFLIGLIVDKNFVLPLLGLSRATKEIKGGNFSFKLNVNSKDKIIKNIYNNFNDMAENLDAKEKLRQCFISNLTHDLRTPLVSQAQSLEFISLKFKDLGLENEFELAESLAKNNEHLLKMVNLILESYCFDTSKLKLNIQKQSLFEIVEGCRDKLKPLIEEKKLSFINSIDKNAPFVDADFINLTRVFMNLLSNAIENTSENKFIKISSNFCENEVIITIEDNGNGIAPEDLKFIFERYYSGKSLERKLGSGFGLSVCEKLISMHNGKISVESEINKYTKFTISLPVIN